MNSSDAVMPEADPDVPDVARVPKRSGIRQFRCMTCQFVVEIDLLPFRCPRCGASRVKMQELAGGKAEADEEERSAPG